MTRDLPRIDAYNGGPVVPADQRHWGPGGRPEHPELVVRWTPSTSFGWRAYHESMFPPGRLVTPWVRFKVMSTGVNVARRLWDQRQEHAQPTKPSTAPIQRTGPIAIRGL